MPGRNAKPIEIQILEGNPNRLTKEDIIAYKKWKTLIKEFKAANDLGVFLLSSTDIGILARYCKTYSEYRSLIKHKENMDNIDFDYGETMNCLEEVTSEARANAIFRKIDYMLSVDGIIRLETALNKKQDMLIKMEDRLFLNPLLDNLITYSYDIINGRIIACKKHIWACQRFLRDLERENSDEFPYILLAF